MFGDYFCRKTPQVRPAAILDGLIIRIRAESIRQTLINKDPKDVKECYQLDWL